MRQISGFDCNLTFNETDRILSLTKSAHYQQDAHTGRRYIWRNLVEVSVDLTDIAFSLLQPAPPVRNLEVGKRCLIPEVGLVISADRVSRLSHWRSRTTAHSQFIDAEKIRHRLKVRFFQTGDRFRPLGMQGFKKLSDFFIDAKVPRHKRAFIPLVVCGDEIVWVCGYRLDDRFKMTEETRAALHLQSAALTSLQEG